MLWGEAHKSLSTFWFAIVDDVNKIDIVKLAFDCLFFSSVTKIIEDNNWVLFFDLTNFWLVFWNHLRQGVDSCVFANIPFQFTFKVCIGRSDTSMFELYVKIRGWIRKVLFSTATFEVTTAVVFFRPSTRLSLIFTFRDNLHRLLLLFTKPGRFFLWIFSFQHNLSRFVRWILGRLRPLWIVITYIDTLKRRNRLDFLAGDSFLNIQLEV